MALKVLMLRKKINDAKKALDQLTEKDADFAKRESEIAASIEEAETKEEREAVETAIAEFETEQAEHKESKASLERMISELEGELEAEEAEQETPAERSEEKDMNTRDKVFGKMTMQERAAFVAREDVKEFLGEIRSCIREKRALKNVGLTVPTVMLGMLRENVLEYSKLYKHVDVRPIGGDGRVVIMGKVPEAVWTDACANINELDLDFSDEEFGCWRVGGFYPVCNATLEDSDIDLAGEIMNALGQAIGRALDKAILYGTGTRMPLGIVPRLAQTSKPADYPATARAWEDLHSSNIKTTSATGVALYQDIVTDFGAAKGKYSRGTKVWVMNEKTYTYLTAQAMGIDAAGAIVSGVNGTMPVAGGVIEVLDFIPDNQIIAGYYDLYLLTERAGNRFASSEHYRFLADQTIFKGTARYDGKPVIPEGFVLIAVNGGSATTALDFAADDANDVKTIALPNAATVVSGESIQLVAFTAPGTGTVNWSSATTAKATVSSTGLVTGVASGSSVITATCNGLSATCTVTVTTE